MALYELVDFLDIVDAVREELGIQSSDTTTINKIKRDINMVYLHEVVPAKRWKWLEGEGHKVHKAYYSGGTAAVTPDSTTVTLSVAPDASQGSFAGYLMTVDGFDEIYTISAHTATSTTVTLESEYQGQVNATASFKIFRDRIDLPTDAKETVDVWHDRSSSPMKGVSKKELRQIITEDPKAEGFPVYYSTVDYYDPTPLTDETESDRYRQTRIYPAINTENVTIHYEYVKEASPLEDDADEPLMPLEDRIILVYGALARGWTKIGRNVEESTRNYQLFAQKLARMMGNQEDSPTIPSIGPKSRYLARMRSSRLGSYARRSRNFGGESAIGNITFLEGVTLKGGNITANFTVDSGITIDGRDISVDGTTLDSIATLTAGIGTPSRAVVTDASGNLDESVITSSELIYLNDAEGTQSATLADNTAAMTTFDSWVSADYKRILIEYKMTRGTATETGELDILYDSNTDSATDAQSFQVVGTMGVTLQGTVDGSNIVAQYTTTSTGSAATIEYTVRKWGS